MRYTKTLVIVKTCENGSNEKLSLRLMYSMFIWTIINSKIISHNVASFANFWLRQLLNQSIYITTQWKCSLFLVLLSIALGKLTITKNHLLLVPLDFIISTTWPKFPKQEAIKYSNSYLLKVKYKFLLYI